MPLHLDLLPISAVVQKLASEGYDVSVSQINKFIRLGIIEKPKVKDGKKALFNKDQIWKIREALHYRMLGASLPEIKEIFELEDYVREAVAHYKDLSEDEAKKYADRDLVAVKQDKLYYYMKLLKQKNERLVKQSEIFKNHIKQIIVYGCERKE